MTDLHGHRAWLLPADWLAFEAAVLKGAPPPDCCIDVPGASWPLPSQSQLEACWWRLLGDHEPGPGSRPAARRISLEGPEGTSEWLERWEDIFAFGSRP